VRTDVRQTAFILTTLVTAACTSEPPAYPAVVVDVDTDLPVPAVIARMQVDVFDERGVWVDSRRFAFSRREDLPTSFGIAMRDDRRATSILVRIRAHAEGAERDYLGERFVPRERSAPVRTPSTLGELCADATELPPNETRIVRVGPTPLFRTTCDRLDNLAGSAAAYVTITEAGRYRFDVLPLQGLLSQRRVFTTPTLHLVKDCMQPTSMLDCSVLFEDGVGGSASIEHVLDPGRYALVTGSWDADSIGDVALRWSLASAWGTPASPALGATDVDDTAAPRALALAAGESPSVEPAPDATIDRLVRIELRPGAPARVRVVLRGACAGTMARLAVEGGHVVADASATCVDEEGVLRPVPAGGDEQTGPAFADEPCGPDDSDDDVVCVPGGAFVLGGGGAPLPGEQASTPMRIAAVRRFFLDRREYTVARYRAARSAGVVLGRPAEIGGPLPNEGPLVGSSRETAATFSEGRRDREAFPLNRLRWGTARDLCRFAGGDLPTEAQWERAASWGADAKRFFPWGVAPVTCETTVAGRDPAEPVCPGRAPLVAVTSDELANDVGALGILGLGGNVSEYVLGSPRRYDDRCFRGASVIDPLCLEPTEGGRVLRGGEWRRPAGSVATVSRLVVTTTSESEAVGFRCAYRERPQ
jgi:formylglycine-generating enzyme required for sulfatase activity